MPGFSVQDVDGYARETLPAQVRIAIALAAGSQPMLRSVPRSTTFQGREAACPPKLGAAGVETSSLTRGSAFTHEEEHRVRS